MNNRLAIFPMLLASLAASGQADKGIEQKMRGVIIPCIEFRSAHPVDVLEFLVASCTASNPDTPSSGLLSTNPPALRVSYIYEVEDGSPLELRPLTLEYRRISLSEAIARITKELGLTYRLENDALVFFTKDGKRIIRKKSVEQAGPGRPPQGFGFPDVRQENE